MPELPERLLPVFVLDRYEGLEARLLGDFTAAERDAYVEANAAALRELGPADLVFANHVVLGAPVGAASGMRVPGQGARLGARVRDARPARPRGLGRRDACRSRGRLRRLRAHPRRAREVVRHVDRVEIVPPGVDVDEFRPEPRDEALAALLEEARPTRRIRATPTSGFPTRATPGGWRGSSRDERPTVVYFGKLIENKGVHVLLEAIAGLDARAVVVGFGDYREELEALAPLGTLFTGALEHRHLRHLLPLCDVAVVPSIFPEAFGMVAAEAASAGVLPVVSAHSGLAEVAAGIGEEVGPERPGSSPSRRETPPRCASASLRSSRCLPSEGASWALAARRAVERAWSWQVVAARLLALQLAPGASASVPILPATAWPRCAASMQA